MDGMDEEIMDVMDEVDKSKEEKPACLDLLRQAGFYLSSLTLSIQSMTYIRPLRP